ncbi:MAG: hypothetical protein V1726_00165 [Methanobacteriota archaeon]
MIEEKSLTFEDGVLLCKHIYQCAIHKTLHGVIEEWEIFQKTHEILSQLEQQRNEDLFCRLEQQYDKKRLEELLFEFNIENVYTTI